VHSSNGQTQNRSHWKLTILLRITRISRLHNGQVCFICSLHRHTRKRSATAQLQHSRNGNNRQWKYVKSSSVSLSHLTFQQLSKQLILEIEKRKKVNIKIFKNSVCSTDNMFLQQQRHEHLESWGRHFVCPVGIFKHHTRNSSRYANSQRSWYCNGARALAFMQQQLPFDLLSHNFLYAYIWNKAVGSCSKRPLIKANMP